MYLRNITIEGIRSIGKMTIDFGPSDKAGWHVIVGPNGSGKSTIVRAIALAMLGERDVDASRIPLETWRRYGSARSCIAVKVEMPRSAMRQEARSESRSRPLSWTTHLEREPTGTVASRKEAKAAAEHLPWNSTEGSFSAAFGSFRRLSGGDKEQEALSVRRPRLGAHLTALSDGATLAEAERWLQDMHLEELEAERDLRHAFEGAFSNLLGRFLLARRASAEGLTAQARRHSIVRALDGELGDIEKAINARLRLGAVKAIRYDVFDQQDAEVLGDRVLAETHLEIDSLSRRILRFLNVSGFLFEQLQILEIRKDRITVRTSDGMVLGLDQLSDGFRSIIGLGLEILRLMLGAYRLDRFQRSLDDENGVMTLPGIVVIDEIEAHLHPPWQEAVGAWLRRCFPRVQFIVTTHSPIVCRAIASRDRLRGSVWVISEESGDGSGIRRLTGAMLERLVYGDILEAMGTETFGSNVEQSDEAAVKLDRLAELNRKDIHEGLAPAERVEADELRRIFPTHPFPLPR